MPYTISQTRGSYSVIASCHLQAAPTSGFHASMSFPAALSHLCCQPSRQLPAPRRWLPIMTTCSRFQAGLARLFIKLCKRLAIKAIRKNVRGVGLSSAGKEERRGGESVGYLSLASRAKGKRGKGKPWSRQVLW